MASAILRTSRASGVRALPLPSLVCEVWVVSEHRGINTGGFCTSWDLVFLAFDKISAASMMTGEATGSKNRKEGNIRNSLGSFQDSFEEHGYWPRPLGDLEITEWVSLRRTLRSPVTGGNGVGEAKILPPSYCYSSEPDLKFSICETAKAQKCGIWIQSDMISLCNLTVG